MCLILFHPVCVCGQVAELIFAMPHISDSVSDISHKLVPDSNSVWKPRFRPTVIAVIAANRLINWSASNFQMFTLCGKLQARNMMSVSDVRFHHFNGIYLYKLLLCFGHCLWLLVFYFFFDRQHQSMSYVHMYIESILTAQIQCSYEVIASGSDVESDFATRLTLTPAPGPKLDSVLQNLGIGICCWGTLRLCFTLSHHWFRGLLFVCMFSW